MMMIADAAGRALLLAFGMFWKVAWSLVLGFVISALLQTFVSREALTRVLGRAGLREIALATLAGAASSSCSYASAAISRTLFQRGAALIPSVAFLFASTNLVIELGIVLFLLLGWQFTLGEWIGGVVLIAILSALIRLTYPEGLVEEARRRAGHAGGHDHPRGRGSLGAIAQSFVMDWSMLWKDLMLGFLIAGAMSAFIPEEFWQTLFLNSGPAWLQVPANAAIGPLVAIVSFVCSIGNVPMAAILWSSGVGFAGVLSFLYADLIVLPLLDVYRRYYGIKMAAYMGAVFYAAMVLAAIVMDGAFSILGWIPSARRDVAARMTDFSLDYTFWLNLVFGALALWLFIRARAAPAAAASHCEHHHGH